MSIWTVRYDPDKDRQFRPWMIAGPHDCIIAACFSETDAKRLVSLLNDGEILRASPLEFLKPHQKKSLTAGEAFTDTIAGGDKPEFTADHVIRGG